METCLRCPNCNGKLEKVKEPDVTIEKCTGCGGVFLDKGELNSLATGMSGDIEFCSIDEEECKDKFPARQCPKCAGQKMKKIDLLVYSDIIFDYCPGCEGFFLDKGEIGKMNVELESLSKKGVAEEFRGYLNDHLVRLDKLSETALGAIGGVAYPANTCYLRLSVYFDKPLNLGLRVYSEKWTEKLAKFIGLFRKQDIQTGCEDLDPLFVIQGKDKEKVISLLSSDEIRQWLLDFVNRRPIMIKSQGKLEILDKRIIYTEGPYSEKVNYDVKEDPTGVVKRILQLATFFERKR